MSAFGSPSSDVAARTPLSPRPRRGAGCRSWSAREESPQAVPNPPALARKSRHCAALPNTPESDPEATRSVAASAQRPPTLLASFASSNGLFLAALEFFFQLQILCCDLCDHAAHPRKLGHKSRRLRVGLTLAPTVDLLQCRRRRLLRHRSPLLHQRRTDAVLATDLRQRHPRLPSRFQNRRFSSAVNLR